MGHTARTMRGRGPCEAHLPDLVEDVHPGLLQKDVLHEGPGDGEFLGAGLQQVLPEVGLLQHVGAQALGSIHHGLQQRLQCSRVRGKVDHRGAAIHGEAVTEDAPSEPRDTAKTSKLRQGASDSGWLGFWGLNPFKSHSICPVRVALLARH